MSMKICPKCGKEYLSLHSCENAIIKNKLDFEIKEKSFVGEEIWKIIEIIACLVFIAIAILHLLGKIG